MAEFRGRVSWPKTCGSIDSRSAAIGGSGAVSLAAGGVEVLSISLDLSALTGDLTVRATLLDDDASAAPSVTISRDQ